MSEQTATTTTTTNAPTTADKKSIPCRFFQNNACRNGAACAFSHVLVPKPAAPAAAAATPAAAATTTTATTTTTTTTTAGAARVPQQVSLKANTANANKETPAAAAAAAAAAAVAAPVVAGGLPIHAAPVLIVLQPGVPVFSIDVECVATGTQHNARATGQIALVDHAENAVLNLCACRVFFFLVITIFFAFFS